MRYSVKKIGRALKKTAALLIYLVLSIVTYLFEFGRIIYKAVSLPLAAMILLIATVTIFSSGFNKDLAPWIAGSIIALLIRLVLPLISSLLNKMKDAAERKFRSIVISVKSPVRYTL